MICKGLRGLEGAIQTVVALTSGGLVGSRSQARHSINSEPQRTPGPRISNGEIPRLGPTLTLEKSTRAAFLIAKKSHIADSLFSGTTRARRCSATDPRVISNRRKSADYAFLRYVPPLTARRPSPFHESALRFRFSRIFSINVCSFRLGIPAGSLLFGGTH